MNFSDIDLDMSSEELEEILNALPQILAELQSSYDSKF